MLPKYTSVGCYPLFYLTAGCEVLCPACASAEPTTPPTSDVNWEDPALYCDECSERIESAYAEP
jgi:hypothetical protein